jgi:hypothetical protein
VQFTKIEKLRSLNKKTRSEIYKEKRRNESEKPKKREKLTCDNTNTQSNDLLQRLLYTKTQPLSLYRKERKTEKIDRSKEREK